MSDTETIVFELPRSKGNGEIIRATTSTFKGQAYFGLRVWFKDENSGKMRPGKNGINLPRSEWGEFDRAVEALKAAMTVATAEVAEESSHA